MRPSLTSLCTRCLVRCDADSSRCPRCGETRLLDLRRERGRRGVLRALSSRPPGALVRWVRAAELSVGRGTQLVAWPVAIAVFFVLFATHGSARAAAILAVAAAIVLLTTGSLAVTLVSTGTFAAELVARFSGWLGRGKVERRRAHPLPAPRPDGETVRTRIRGRARTLRTIESPVSRTPCVAFRISGQTAGSEIDDAGLVAFAVVTAEGEMVHVDAGPATIALDVDADPPLVRPDADLTRFLEERAALVALGPVRLAEAVIHEGDEVVVEGVVKTQESPVGYRQTATERALVERPGAPLVIRLPRDGD